MVCLAEDLRHHRLVARLRPWLQPTVNALALD